MPVNEGFPVDFAVMRHASNPPIYVYRQPAVQYLLIYIIIAAPAAMDIAGAQKGEFVSRSDGSVAMVPKDISGPSSVLRLRLHRYAGDV